MYNRSKKGCIERSAKAGLNALFSRKTVAFSRGTAEPIAASFMKIYSNVMIVPPCRVHEESDPPIDV